MLGVFGFVFFAVGLVNVGANLMLGLAFMLGGLGIAVGFNMIFVRRTQLILDGPRDLAELRRRGWMNYTIMTWELRHLDRAIVEGTHSDDSDTHRAALVIKGGMDAGTHPLTLVSSSGDGAHRARDAINSWLDSHRPAA